ncbi:hypothetical protein C0J52_26351 [Blattella germanica]|nr:hypothetical protein C0J52_26351 [Blattella germanica]
MKDFVDGWELNRQFFPSPQDHPKPLNLRYREFCGQRKVKQVLESSQNAALIQYRLPARGKGFSFTVRFLKNSTPCNILLEGTADVYTLRNYGKRVNCSLTTLYPANVKVLSLNCEKRGLPDYVQLGGSEGLDTTHLTVADSICGLDSKPAYPIIYTTCSINERKYRKFWQNVKEKIENFFEESIAIQEKSWRSTVETIFCGVTTVRVVSSGEFDNAVTVALRQAGEEDIMEASLICGL